MWNNLLTEIQNGNIKSLARCISLVENEAAGFDEFMRGLPVGETKIIGITGPPGAGKSTITDALLELFIKEGKRIAVICVDPSSPFNMGALLGDRIRMSRWYNEPGVYIRSLATRGSLGGLHPKILEITEILKAGNFDLIIIETVGVGQSEIEITGMADVTIVAIVPEAGDEIQTMKAGIMEIADVFVVNKADRPGADQFVKNLRMMLAPSFSNHNQEIEIIKTTASKNVGIAELKKAIETVLAAGNTNDKQSWLAAEKAFYLLQKERMKDVDRSELKSKWESRPGGMNLYNFIKSL